jgi:hypothetical protein
MTHKRCLVSFYFWERRTAMRTIQSELKRLGIKKRPENKSRKKHINENLTEREIKDLMGVNRPTYKRHKGAYRQRS